MQSEKIKIVLRLLQDGSITESEAVILLEEKQVPTPLPAPVYPLPYNPNPHQTGPLPGQPWWEVPSVVPYIGDILPDRTVRDKYFFSVSTKNSNVTN